ncbi:MAG: hypothetical protein ACE5D0_03645 [Fidelibacterota bacterium]
MEKQRDLVILIVIDGYVCICSKPIYNEKISNQHLKSPLEKSRGLFILVNAFTKMQTLQMFPSTPRH